MAIEVQDNEKRDDVIQPSSAPRQTGHLISDAEKNAISLAEPNVEPAIADTASNSTALTNTPLVPEPETETRLARFNSVTARDGRNLDGPPPLPFNLREHKLSLSIFTLLALAECCFVPIAFYYGFSQGSNVRSGMLSHVLEKSIKLTLLYRNLFRHHYESFWLRERLRGRNSRVALGEEDGRISTALWKS